MPRKKQQDIYSILEQYKDLNFVDRILNKDNYPTLDLGDGNYASHKMSYAEFDGKAYVYPNVIYDKKSNKLIELEPSQAIEYALQSGEFIPFDDPKQAEWFSKNYKSVWDKPKSKTGMMDITNAP